MDDLHSKMVALNSLVCSNICYIRDLESKKVGSTGNLKEAYELIIRDKLMKIQNAIGVFWRETLNLVPAPATLPATIVHSIPPFISGIP